MIHRICIVAVFVSTAFVQGQDTAKEYADLLERVKKSDPKVDFLKLRLAFTQTPAYDPYAVDTKTVDEMSAAFLAKDYAKAADLAQQVVKANFVDGKAHLIAYRSLTELKDPSQAKFHKYVLDGLLKSIMKSGNGKSAATAMDVISIGEENLVLGVLGIRKNGQSLIDEKGQKIDRIDGIDIMTQAKVTLYFNVDRQFRWLGKQLQKGE